MDIRLGNERGDLLLSWDEGTATVIGTHATDAEVQRLRDIAEKHELTVDGDLTKQATLTAAPEKLQAALNEFLEREREERREKGYALYGIPKAKGKGRGILKGKRGKPGKGVVIQVKEQVDVGEYEEIVAAPSTAGG